MATDNTGTPVVRLPGQLNRIDAASLWRETLRAIRSAQSKRLILDFQDVSGIDTAGVALLQSLKHFCEQRHIEVTEKNQPEPVAQFLQYIRKRTSALPKQRVVEVADPISRLGAWGLLHLRDARAFVQLLGDFIAAAAKQLRSPGRLRMRETLYQIQLVGVGAVPLVVGLSLLLGALMVFQGMNSVRNFGNIIYIADMVVIAVAREMGPLLTAVILAGRSGAAFAAEIGTMKLNEELDALAVMDLDSTRFLVLPRVFAMMVAGPCLTMLSDASGILGGMITSWATLGLPITSFLHESHRVLAPNDFYTGLIKGFVFAGFVGLIGCFRGLRSGFGPGNVGIQTTSAVVTGIFVVILLDTFLSYVFQMFGW